MTINYLSSATSIAQTSLYSNLNKTSQTSQTSGAQQDSFELSDFGKLMKQLSSLQQSDPTKFKEATAKIAEKLEEAAKSAAESGDSDQASALNDLAAKFRTSSETGEMPDLRPSSSSQSEGGQRARGPHGGPPPMGPPPDSDSDDESGTTSDSTTTDSTSSSSTISATLLKALSAYQQQSTTSDPMSILSGILKDVLSSSSTSSSTALAA